MTPQRRKLLLDQSRKIQTRATDTYTGALAGIVAELLADEAGAEPTLTKEDMAEVDGIFASMDRLFARVFRRAKS